MELNGIIEQRAAKLESLRGKGLSLYGQAFAQRLDIGAARSDFQEGKKVSLSGRVMAKRSHGKVSFLDLRDSTGRIQLYLKADFLSKDKLELLEYIDIADIIAVKGELFKTHTQEI